jgi:hypothetical protein
MSAWVRKFQALGSPRPLFSSRRSLGLGDEAGALQDLGLETSAQEVRGLVPTMTPSRRRPRASDYANQVVARL